MTEINDSPNWNNTTKLVVVLIGLLLFALLAWRFQSLIIQVIVAAMLAYVLFPLISLISEKTKMTYGVATLIVYLVVVSLFLGSTVALGVAAYGQVVTFINAVPRLVTNSLELLQDFTQRSVVVGGFTLELSTIDWDAITNQALGLVQPTVSQGGQLVGRVAVRSVEMLGYLVFVLVISIYFANEVPRLGGYLASVAHQPGYRQDAERLMRDFGRIWSAYLRGQIVLGLIIATIVSISLGIMGVQNALALGLLSGLLEFVPVLGPLIGAGAAILVAFFQPSNYLDLTSLQFALSVAAIMFVIQQLENNILVPRIVGDSLDLHPLMVMIGVFMGGSIAGITGAILAGPIVATFKLLGIYAWRKLFDLPPFPEPEDEDEPPLMSSLSRRVRELLGRLRQRLAKPAGEGEGGGS